MNVYKNITELIGHTPVVALDKLAQKAGAKAKLYAKLECYNPTGSMKDRVGLAMIRQAEKDGKLKPGGTIIEPTSGNTGIGIAAVGAYLGYKVVIVMPDSMSIERRKLMQIYGAELVLTPGAKGMSGAIARAEELVKEMDNAIIAGQFVNPANPQAHYDTTGPEAWEQLDGHIDVLVAGVGTGGSLSGTGRFLKEKNPAVHIIAVEPAASPVWAAATQALTPSKALAQALCQRRLIPLSTTKSHQSQTMLPLRWWASSPAKKGSSWVFPQQLPFWQR